MGKLAMNNTGEYFQDSQFLMKHKQIRLSPTTTRSSQLVNRRRRPLTRSIVRSYNSTDNGMTQLHDDWRDHAHKATLYPTANVARQAVLTLPCRNGVSRPPPTGRRFHTVQQPLEGKHQGKLTA